MSLKNNSENTQPEDIEKQKAKSTTLLFVDDERNILSSLKRLFRPLNYRIFLANSGAEGLEIMNNEQVDLVISDMRMPEMDGAEFLEKVSTTWPDTVRLLLTGYADMSSTIAAINKGKITQYISKPWDDNDIKITVQQALKFKLLEAERDELLEITRKQNEELLEFNTNLEGLVEARTQELEQTMGMLDSAYQTLKSGYSATIKVFSNLVELREGNSQGNSRTVAEQAQKLALALGMEEDQAQQVSYAGMLRGIGTIGYSDEYLSKPVILMDQKNRQLYEKHTILGEATLMTLEPLISAAKIIRNYHERYDGKGFPDGLAANEIPLGSRILSVISDFNALQAGTLVENKMTAAEAEKYISDKSGSVYDPKVVESFIKHTPKTDVADEAVDKEMVKVHAAQLKEGMVLAKDLNIKGGIVLLSKGHKLGQHVIKQINNLEKTLKETLEIFVCK